MVSFMCLYVKIYQIVHLNMGSLLYFNYDLIKLFKEITIFSKTN